MRGEAVPSVNEALGQWLGDLELAGQRSTAQGYRFSLRALERRDVPSVRDLTPALCRALMVERSREVADGTLRKSHYILRAFCRWCVDQGWLLTNPTDGLACPRQQRPPHRFLSVTQLRRFYEVCASDTDRLIVLLCGGAGLRSAEFLRLTVRNIDLDGAVARVLGKGPKWREVGLDDFTVEEMRRILPASGPVTEIRSGEGVRYHVRAIARRAGVGHCTVHMLRHSFSVAFLELGGDAFSLQAILGHANPAMTAFYVRSVRERVAVRRQREVGLPGRLFGNAPSGGPAGAGGE